jgi:O-acetylhomoserine/O-acetylserine sulfhydrylase-like pyridoxal-dependent enzyme
LAQRLLPRGAGSMVAFGVKGGRAAGGKFISTVKLCSHLANVGDAKTLVIHPASTTHQQMNAEQLVAAGISEDMVRLRWASSRRKTCSATWTRPCGPRRSSEGNGHGIHR